MQFYKNQFSVLWYVFYGVNVYICVSVTFLWSINKTYKPCQTIQKEFLLDDQRSPLPAVIFRGRGFGEGQIATYSTENCLLVWLDIFCLVKNWLGTIMTEFKIMLFDMKKISYYFKYFPHFIKIMNLEGNLNL